MAAQSDTVAVQVELARDEYERIEEQARREHRPVSDVIPRLVSSELQRRANARRMMEEVSASYRARLAAEGKLDQTPEEFLDELRALREQIADELYPG